MELSKGALAFLAERGYACPLKPSGSDGWRRWNPVYRARPLKRIIQHELVDKMALMLLDGEIKEGQTVKVDASKSGELVIKA